jgi:hypothetical protein
MRILATVDTYFNRQGAIVFERCAISWTQAFNTSRVPTILKAAWGLIYYTEAKRRSIGSGVYVCTPISHTVSKYEQVGVVFLQIKPPLTFVTNPIRLVTKSRRSLIRQHS